MFEICSRLTMRWTYIIRQFCYLELISKSLFNANRTTFLTFVCLVPGRETIYPTVGMTSRSTRNYDFDLSGPTARTYFVDIDDGGTYILSSCDVTKGCLPWLRVSTVPDQYFGECCCWPGPNNNRAGNCR